MRLASVVVDGKGTVAVRLDSGGLVPLPALDPALPSDLLSLLRQDLDEEFIAALTQSAADSPRSTHLDERTVHYLPLLQPGKILGIGLNYRQHAEELGADLPSEPASFFKAPHTVTGHGSTILLPPQSQRVDAEAELGIVIGKECWQVDQTEALRHVAGVCPILDQTALDILSVNPRFLTRAKNFATFFSCGPWMLTLHAALATFGTLGAIRVATYRNGQRHRDDALQNAVFDPAFLVSFHSKVMPLYPGDIIATGTPGGAVVDHGDVVQCRIAGVGVLTNRVRRPTAERYADDVRAALRLPGAPHVSA
jgi:2-keto-4-pentenoate hydratase/2-oxohepta-3-ene-1,7-dioic acid hydratase in catechol pathway